MTAIRKAIKIEVIDEDELGPGAKPKRKPATKAAKPEPEPVAELPKKTGKKSLVAPIVAEELGADKLIEAMSSGVKKKLVSEEIDQAESTENSFAEKLRKELESSAPMSKKSARKTEESLPEEDAAILRPASDKLLSVKSQLRDEYAEVQSAPVLRAPVAIYRRIVMFFVPLVIVMGLAAAYFLFGKVSITLVPNQENISNNLVFDVNDADIAEGETPDSVLGAVKTMKIEEEAKFESSGAEIIGQEAIGQVTLINNYNKNQMLVATTRLLAASGEMFRLKNTVNVPAGGQVEAEIYADEPSAEMAIEPTKFTIPGLWAGIQDKIYAKSDKAVVYQQKTKKHVTQEDIDKAGKEMRQKLVAAAKTETKKAYADFDELIYDINEDTIDFTVDSEVGDEVDEFGMKMSADVIVVAFASDAAAGLAEKKFVSSLADNKKMVSFDKEGIIFTLGNFNANEGKATINATFEGKVSADNGEKLVEKDMIYGLNPAELDAFLAQKKEISGYTVKFYPAFLPNFLKKVPRLPDRIEVIVKE